MRNEKSSCNFDNFNFVIWRMPNKREVKESNTFHKLIPNFQYFQMIDRNNGWAIGENMGENKVFITNDGGTTWVTALTSAIGDIREWFYGF